MSISSITKKLDDNLSGERSSAFKPKSILCDSSVKGHCWTIDDKADEFLVFQLLEKIKNIATDPEFKDLFHLSDPQDMDIELEIIANILSKRGIDADNIESFIRPKLRDVIPDPSILKDMDSAVDLVYQHIIDNKKIAIFGDYDVDGATSSSLLYLFFNSIGIKPAVYIPDRIKEGYGPNKEAFKKLRDSGVELIITLDCGTNAFEVMDYAKEIGLKTIIIDHHVSEVNLPNADAIINPNRFDEDETNTDCKNLAAVGVSFLFLIGLRRKLRQEKYYQKKNLMETNLLDFLDIVALGTVCDVMQITGLNRVLVAQGLQVMSNRNNMGINALSNVAGISDDKKITTYDLGFVYGPRINAGGRVGCARLGFELLTATDAIKAMSIAQRLDGYNTDRKDIEAMVLEEARNQAIEQVKNNDKSIIVSGDNWHEGVIGIVAGRLKEEFSVPTAVIAMNADGVGKASARSIKGFDFGVFVHNAVHEGILLGGGGHAMAAGFSIERDNIVKLKDLIEVTLKDVDITPSTKVDAVIDISAASIPLIEAIDLFAPYGVGNPKPKFVIKDAHIEDVKILKDKHLKLRLRDKFATKRIDGLLFNVAESNIWDLLLNSPLQDLSDKSFNILGSLDINSWGGRISPQILIDDLVIS